MFSNVSDILLFLLFITIALSVVYLFVLAVSGKILPSKTRYRPVEAQKKIAVFIPAYKEDNIILSTAKSMLLLDYPRELYDVYILADSFHQRTLDQLSDLPVRVIEVRFEKSTKAKALNEGFGRIVNDYDVVLICDADNVLAKNFLNKVNAAFVAGAKGIQGQRVAKNFDSPYAVLDACSEGINNHIFRKGTNAVGLSSSIIGSGMAFEYKTCQQVLSQIDAVGGFDRPLQIHMAERGVQIMYLEDALIFDEKVDSVHAFKQQRKRWISSQFIYLNKYFRSGIKKLWKGNISYFNLAIANNLVLPRGYLLLLLPLSILLGYIAGSAWLTYFVAATIVYVGTLILSLPPKLINKNLLRAIIKIPQAVFAMALAAFQSRNANKTFIHTVHTKNEVSNPLYREVSD